MREFLVKRFIKDYEKTEDIKVRERYGILSSFVGIVCNIILFSAKFTIGAMSNSIAIISDGFNNLSDCASCIVTMFGYKMAAKPADKDHPFGHGRMEYLTALLIAIIILFVGVELLKGSWNKITNPEEIEFSMVALAVIVLSILIKVWMGFFNRILGKRVKSSVMLATSKDSFNDVIATGASLIALVASLFTDAPIDGIMGIVVSIFILLSGYGIIKETVDQLLGQPADEELVDSIKELVEESAYAIGMHDLIIHCYGPGNLIGSVHVEVDGKGDIMEIHDAIDELERNIYEELGVMITIHMDPVETDNEEINTAKDILNDIIKKIDANLSMHDFRMVSGPSHTNLIFDIVIPYDCKLSKKFIKDEIDHRLKAYNKIYYTVITFDNSFT